MSDRPTGISPSLLAALFESAPGRIRRRLDKQPNVANDWRWEANEQGVQISAGEQTVTLKTNDGIVESIEQIECTCLLAPKCFHIIACVNVLDAIESPALDTDASPVVDQSHSDESTSSPISSNTGTEVTSEMRVASRQIRNAASNLIQVGARGAGALIQAQLLRAAQQCRAAGLPALGNAALRVAESVRLVRRQSNQTDVSSLRQDLTFVLAVTESIARQTPVEPWMIGTSRREFHATDVKQLCGWFAEPILTRSGFAGVCVHLLAPNGTAYQISDVRPGPHDWVFQAYRGGIELGTTHITGSQLSRRQLTVQNLTASSEGRLGKGKTTRWAERTLPNDPPSALSTRLNEPFTHQLERVFEEGGLPEQARRGAWDLVTFQARILGAQGPALIAEETETSSVIHLRIANDHPELCFRHNLQLLARCPGVSLQVVGRLRADVSGDVDLLAIRGSTQSDDEIPQLALPEDWCNLCNLGLDRLERHHFTKTERWGVEIELTSDAPMSRQDDGLAELERRLSAVALGGYLAVPNLGSETHRRDFQALHGRGQPIAARLQEILATAQSARMSRDTSAGTKRELDAMAFDSAVLACETYVRAARNEFQSQQWKQLVSDG